ncbi:beta family protein [Pseudomonas chlororaphis]|uniref:beta family protein n=1 Tax=Pseudomonas chlororaphis TaxID=587753 RepID=UPI002367D91F|nr:beta family protein [Pseudomonas chlororaphis]WDH51184.1 beta family protein [Pseudomonas chlororaphis]
MNNQYFPIVRAKAGEMEAFSRLDKSTIARCTPVFEVTKLDGRDLERARKRSSTPFEDYLDTRAKNIADVFKDKHVILDVSQWPVGFTTEGGEQVLSYICSRLDELGVIVCPVIGYDRWESIEYRETIKSMNLADKAFFCIRLDSLAIEDLGDPEHLDEIIEDMISSANLSEASTPVLIDIGDVTKLPVQDIMEVVETAYGHMKGLGFDYIIMSASSIPDSIEKAVKERDSNGMVQRKEMIVWKGFMSANPGASLYFSDYGVRNPRASDIIATHMNVKIRYTVSNAFFIVRGHSIQGEDGYAQSQKLSREIVNSIHYREPDFSWGDLKIMECSLGKITGSSTNWISFDTNHHIESVASEIFEFTTQLAAVAARV